MHDQRPSDPEGEYLPPVEPQAPGARNGRGRRNVAGGTAVGIGALLLKFKGALALLASYKWLLFFPKFALSFGSIFISIWFYALFFGWKLGIVFVLLILVHELGHYVTFRNFGIAANLPFFIPGLGAFVSSRGPVQSLTTEAIVALAGPVFGLGAAAVCFGYAVTTHELFWNVAAYLGFFLNALNLLPIPPFDGGGIAAAIDPRLWIAGFGAFLAWLIFFAVWSPFTIVIAVIVGLTAIPRIMQLRRGVIDPRFAAVPRTSRVAIAAAYFVTLGIAVAGAFATYVPRTHAG